MEMIYLFYNLAVLYKMINTRWHLLDDIKTILQGDVGERFVGGVFLPAGKEGRVAREEDVRENSNRPHVWNAN